MFQKCEDCLKILGVTWVGRTKFHSVDTLLLGTTAHDVVTWDLWTPGLSNIKEHQFSFILHWLILVNNQLDALLWCVYLFMSLLSCFEQPSAHHQENQLYQYIIWYISLCVGDCLVCRTRGPAHQAGDLWLFSLSTAISTSKAFSTGNSGSAVCISVCLTSLTTCTFNSWKQWFLHIGKILRESVTKLPFSSFTISVLGW
jgi:hypothetical protein